MRTESTSRMVAHTTAVRHQLGLPQILTSLLFSCLRDALPMSLRWQCACLDCADPEALATWWAGLLGWRITSSGPDEVVLEPPAGSSEDGVSPDLLFLRVPEAKRSKNRLHLDLRPDDQAAEVARALQMGARRVDVGQAESAPWTVLADPEGNEFCILGPLTADQVGA